MRAEAVRVTCVLLCAAAMAALPATSGWAADHAEQGSTGPPPQVAEPVPPPFPLGQTPEWIAVTYGPQLGVVDLSGVEPYPSYWHRTEVNGLKIEVRVAYASDSSQSRLNPTLRATWIRIVLDRPIPLSTLPTYFPRLKYDASHEKSTWRFRYPPRRSPIGDEGAALDHLTYARDFAIQPKRWTSRLYDSRVGYVAYGLEVAEPAGPGKYLYEISFVAEDRTQVGQFGVDRTPPAKPSADAPVASLIIRAPESSFKSDLMPQWDPWQVKAAARRPSNDISK